MVQRRGQHRRAARTSLRACLPTRRAWGRHGWLLHGVTVTLLGALGVTLAVGAVLFATARTGHDPQPADTAGIVVVPTPSSAAASPSGASAGTTPPAASEDAAAVRTITRPPLEHLSVQAMVRQLDRAMASRGYTRHAQATTFVVSSFNVLGAGHTSGRRDAFASGAARMVRAAALIRRYDVSVVGMQEFQTEQLSTFRRQMGSQYAVWPGESLGRHGVANSIAYRTADWTLVSAHTLAIPYFGGHRVPMPVIELQNRSTGKQVWFMNFHNPADAHGNAARWRAAARGIEAAEANRLAADGTPVMLTGDMNDRTEFACPFASATGMHSADGVFYASSCSAPQHLNVDWVFGTGDVAFTSFVADFTTKNQHISDHPMIRARATIGTVDPATCLRRRVSGRTLRYCQD